MVTLFIVKVRGVPRVPRWMLREIIAACWRFLAAGQAWISLVHEGGTTYAVRTALRILSRIILWQPRVWNKLNLNPLARDTSLRVIRGNNTRR